MSNLTDTVMHVRSDGTREWWAKGKRHRLDGPAVEHSNGSREWFVRGIRHRLDGPAIAYADGTGAWWVNDQRHRLDGPAIEYSDGAREWFVEGVEYTPVEFALHFGTPENAGALAQAIGVTDQSPSIAQDSEP